MDEYTSDGYPACLRCGYCCTVGTCPFGRWDEDAHRCAYLTKEMTCGIYERILSSPGNEWSPAFGAGCSSPGNALRREQRERTRAPGAARRSTLERVAQ